MGRVGRKGVWLHVFAIMSKWQQAHRGLFNLSNMMQDSEAAVGFDGLWRENRTESMSGWIRRYHQWIVKYHCTRDCL